MKNIKKFLTSSVLVIAFALGLGVVFAAPTYAVDPTDTSYDSLSEGAGYAKADDQADNLFGAGGIFTKIVNTALFLVGAISVVMLIYGGIRYTLSGGDSTAVGNAKNTILYAIVGIVVTVLAYAIVGFVVGQLKTDTTGASIVVTKEA